VERAHTQAKDALFVAPLAHDRITGGSRGASGRRPPCIEGSAADPGQDAWTEQQLHLQWPRLTRRVLAPWCAMHLADHRLPGAPLDPEVDARTF
jgi:hypothetical protein